MIWQGNKMKRIILITLSLIAIFMCITTSLSADELKDMYTAIEAGDSAKVKAMLDGGFDPNTTLSNGQPPVMAAANSGKADIVSLLIKAGADVSLYADDQLGGNALTGAVWSTGDTHDPANTIKIIQILLDAGIDINSGETRDASSDYKAGGKDWETYINPVWYVSGSSSCSADVLEFMLDKGCTPSRAYAINDANEKQDFGLEDLSDAVKKSKTNKADRKEYNRIVKILKEAKDKSKTPAPAAAPTSVKAPEPAVAQQPAVQKTEQQPVAQQPKQQAVKKPKPQKQPKPEPVKEEKERPSSILSATEATELLRKSAADGNKENFYRSLVMGADINAADLENKTPLVLAVMSNNYEMAEVLIHKGADVNVKTKGGNTPLSLARDLGAKDIEKILLVAGAK